MSLSTVSKRFRDIVLTQIVIDLKNLIHNSPEVCVDFEKCRFVGELILSINIFQSIVAS